MVASDVDGGDTSKIKFHHLLRLHIVSPAVAQSVHGVYLCVYVYKCVCVCLCVYVLYVYTHVCIYCICVCVYIYRYTVDRSIDACI